MNKKLLKTLTGLAIVGTALGAAFAYIKKCKEVNDLGEEDFDDLWDGEEENPEVSSCTPCRSYTTIPSDSPVPEDEKHIEVKIDNVLANGKVEVVQITVDNILSLIMNEITIKDLVIDTTLLNEELNNVL